MSIALLVAVMTAFAFGPMVSVQAARAQAISLPVTGTFTDAAGGTGTFVGNVDLTRFAVQDGALVAIGTLTGTLTDSNGNVVRTVNQTVAFPVSNIRLRVRFWTWSLDRLTSTCLA